MLGNTNDKASFEIVPNMGCLQLVQHHQNEITSSKHRQTLLKSVAPQSYLRIQIHMLFHSNIKYICTLCRYQQVFLPLSKQLISTIQQHWIDRPPLGLPIDTPTHRSQVILKLCCIQQYKRSVCVHPTTQADALQLPILQLGMRHHVTYKFRG